MLKKVIYSALPLVLLFACCAKNKNDANNEKMITSKEEIQISSINEKMLSLPKPSNAIISDILGVQNVNGGKSITGWAYVKKLDYINMKTSFVIKTKKDVLQVLALSSDRPGVQKVHGESNGIDVLKCGFRANINNAYLNEYEEIYLLIESTTGESYMSVLGPNLMTKIQDNN